jgi:nitroimidazol reductase NimA-like FMN-containing flavoprotein (pyridoxamine 5'-phosphate oxidase superfamily)
MNEKIAEMLQDHHLCVLCTEGGGKPYCSLMTYMLAEDQKTLYMTASADSRKFSNLKLNPNVSVLIDTRQDHNSVTETQILSVTLEGVCVAVEPKKVEMIKKVFAVRHPELAEILRAPNCAVMGVRLKSYLLLNGPVKYEQGHF